MKLIIEISAEKYEWFKKNIKNPNKNDTVGAVALGIPYDTIIDEITELLENEWGYEGMREDVARIMKGGAE